MSDGGLDATTIDMDHDAMLASDPKKNAAFMRVFGSYVGQKQGDSLASPAATTQLAQQQHASNKNKASDINAKLAEEMQAKLTAGSQDEAMMTPHCKCNFHINLTIMLWTSVNFMFVNMHGAFSTFAQ